MANLIDYIMWRGDITLEEKKINELDKMIFARLSYLPFKEIEMNQEETIMDIANKMSIVNPKKFIWEDDIQFIDILGNSNRFKDIVITDYIEEIDLVAEKQFSAITIQLAEDEKYISFRGTDSTLVGWKEDFNISFLYNIPSQIEAVKYLNNIARKYDNAKLILGGHSKGGNIAVYASIYCDDDIKERIKEVINADGPGFDESITNDEKYLHVKDKIKNYIPQSSIIGRILEYRDNYTVVQSNQKGIMQHDIYSWEVGPTFLITIKEVTKESEFMNSLLRRWFNTTNAQQREKFINIIYEILKNANITSTKEFPKVIAKNSKKIINSYKNTSAEDKKQLEEMIGQITNLARNIIKEEITTKKK